MPKIFDEHWKKVEWCEKLQNITVFIFVALEIAALVFLFINGYITGFKGILHSVFFVLLSIPCLGTVTNISTLLSVHSLFLISKIVLANHVFNKDIPKIILAFVIMSAVTYVSKLICSIIKKIFKL